MKTKLYSLVIFLMFTAVSVYAFPIPDTGITKCYDDTKEIPCPKEGEDFYGQDANYSINPMSYTKLDENGSDLPITATDWAMVKDNVTGLIWENNSHESTWNDAPNVIASLNTAKFGGYSDWRMPTMTELGSIVDFSVPYPGATINTNAFKDTFAALYWSSSPSASGTLNAWGVYFYNGFASSYAKSGAYYVRAVRAGHSVTGALDNLIINKDGTVYDNTTGLMWQQDTAETAVGSTTMVWKDALSYCQNLTLGGYTDWRLPTIKELRTIVNYSTYSPAIDMSVFNDTVVSFYWSSSPYPYTIYGVWGVPFDYGGDGNRNTYYAYYVRAVRGGQLAIGTKSTATTSPATSITSNSATLNGTVNPNSSATTYYFEYGTSTRYGSKTTTTSAGSGSTDSAVKADITGLTPKTTYHFRLVATNTIGTTNGNDQTFTTLGIPPTVTTGAATAASITEAAATLNGTVNPNKTATTCYFEYGLTTSYGSKTTSQNAGSGSTASAVTANLTGLTYSTTYHFRLVATNSVGTTNGNDQTFTTLGIPPTVTTGAATAASITEAAATLNGTVNPNKTATTCYFEYGLTTSYGSKTTSQNAGSGSTASAVTANLTGLTYSTTYHFRLVATNSVGTTNGNDQTFTTLGIPPKVTTGAATAASITASAATLNGTVNPNKTAATYYFEYGLTTSYGSKTTSQNAGSGSTASAVTANITGLTPSTTYHFRLVAINSAGTTNGNDQTFTTLSIPPTVTTGAATSITSTGATFNGTVNPNKTASTYYFEYGTSTSYGYKTISASAGSGSTASAVTANLTGLTASTTYHFRLVATNSVGTTNGNDQTFTTPANPPEPPSNLTATASETGITLAWNHSPSADIASYRIYWDNGTGTINYTTPYGTVNYPANTTNVSLVNAGTYKFGVRAVNKAGIEEQNTNVIASITVAGFHITLSLDNSIYDRGQNVTVSGAVTSSDREAIVDLPIAIDVEKGGYHRSFTAYTNQSGAYRYIFQPAANEAGTYTVSVKAMYQGLEKSSSVPFKIMGLLLQPSAVSVDMSMNFSKTVSFTLSNIGGTTLTGLKYTVTDNILTDAVTGKIATKNIDTGNIETVSLPEVLASGESVSIPLTITAQAGTPPTTPALFTLNVSSTEGSKESSNLSVNLHQAVPSPVVTPDPLKAAVFPGQPVIKVITVKNEGFAPMTASAVTVHDKSTYNWITIVNGELDTVQPSESKDCQIYLNPTDSVQLGTYVVQLDLAYSGKTMPLYLTVEKTTATDGQIAFTVYDDTGVNVSGAEVSLISKEVYLYDGPQGKQEYNNTIKKTTDADGYALFEKVPVGEYRYAVHAAGHDSEKGEITIEAGTSGDSIDKNSIKKVMLVTNLVEIDFSVTPIKISDEYNVTLNITYTTDLVKPTLYANPSRVDLSFFPEEVYEGIITITNMSNNAPVTDFQLDATEIDSANHEVKIVFADGSSVFRKDGLEPKESVQIPFHATIPDSASAKLNDRSLGNMVATANYIFSYEGKAIESKTTTPIPVFFWKPQDLRIPGISFINDETDGNLNDLEYQGTSYRKTITSNRDIKFTTKSDIKAFSHISGGPDPIDIINTNTGSGSDTLWTQNFNRTTPLTFKGDATTFDIDGLQEALEDQLFDDRETCLSKAHYGGFTGRWADKTSDNGYLIPISITTIRENAIIIGGGGGGSGWGSGVPSFIPPSERAEHGEVKLEIRQKVSLEREAFDAKLSLKPTVSALQNVALNLDIKDSNGKDASSLFFVVVTEQSGIGTLEGGTVSGKSEITWQVIPSSKAGGLTENGLNYTIAASVGYSYNGKNYTYKTAEETITVKPMPKLTINYTLPYVVMAGKPAKIRVKVTNNGAGAAHNLVIESAKPKIVDNPNGIPVGFVLSGSSPVAGDSGYQTGKLTINFGDIAPGKSVEGYWVLVSSKDGYFVEFSSTMSHKNYLGIELDPLIEKVNTNLVPALGGRITSGNDGNMAVELLKSGVLKGKDSVNSTGAFYIQDIDSGDYKLVIKDSAGDILSSQDITILAGQPTAIIHRAVYDTFFCSQEPLSGEPGTTFVQSGDGFTPNSTATLHFENPDGTEYLTQPQQIDDRGHFEISYTAAWDKPTGTYTWWAVDGVTGDTSNKVEYEIIISIPNLTFNPVSPISDTIPSNVMKGGKAVRYYRVFDLNGEPILNGKFYYQINNSTEVFTGEIDDQGFVPITSPKVDTGTATFAVTVTNSKGNACLTKVKNAPSFVVNTSTREFSESYDLLLGFGGSIAKQLGGSFGPVKLHCLKAGIGVGKNVSTKFIFENRENDADFSIQSTLGSEFIAQLEAGLFAGFKVKTLPKVEAGISLEGRVADDVNTKYNFIDFIKNGEINDNKQILEAAIVLLESAINAKKQLSPGMDTLLYALINKYIDIYSDVEADETGHKLTLSGEASIGVDLTLKNPLGRTAGSELGLHVTGIEGDYAYSFGTQLYSDSSLSISQNIVYSINLLDIQFIYGQKFGGDKRKKDTPKFTLKSPSSGYFESAEGEQGVKFRSANGMQELEYHHLLERDEKGFLVVGTNTKEKYSYIKTSDSRAISNIVSQSSLAQEMLTQDNDSNAISPKQYSKLHDAFLSVSDGRVDWETKTNELNIISIPIDFEIGAGISLGFNVKAEAVASTSYVSEKGKIQNGGCYSTEKYDKDKYITNYTKGYKLFIKPVVDAIREVAEEICEIVDGFVEVGKELVVKVGTETWAQIKSTNNALQEGFRVTLSKLNPWNNTYRIRTLRGNRSESQAATIGDVFIVNILDTNNNPVLTFPQPLELKMSYTDSSIVDAGYQITDARNLQIFRLDSESGYYILVGGVVDGNLKTVTTNITKPGQYILGIDKVAPELSNFQLSDNTSRPLISFELHDSLSGINPDSIVLLLDGVEVVNKSTIDSHFDVSTGHFTYQPDSDLTTGQHTLKLTVSDNIGNITAFEKTFEINTSPPVINHEPVLFAKSGERLDIKASGTDDQGLPQLYIHYRTMFGNTSFVVEKMSYSESDQLYHYEIPKHFITSYGIQYYISALDSSSNKSNTQWNDISVEDNIGPIIPGAIDIAYSEGLVKLKWSSAPDIDTVGYKLYLGKDVNNLTLYEDLGNTTFTYLNESFRDSYVSISAYDNLENEGELLEPVSLASLNIKYIVLTNTSPNITIESGIIARVYGSAGVNTINVASGAKVECINFPGANVINIVQDSPSDFTVYRSGATVYFENTAKGTLLKIPATKISQTIKFAGGVSYNLVISNNKVMLEGKEITTTVQPLS